MKENYEKGFEKNFKILKRKTMNLKKKRFACKLEDNEEICRYIIYIEREEKGKIGLTEY